MSLSIQDVMTSYIDNYDPTSNEGSVFNNIMPFYYWMNSITEEIFLSTSQDNTDIIWRVLITSLNVNSYISDYITALGWKINTSRSSSAPTLSFGDSRTPNEDNDTMVMLSISQTSTLLTASDVTVQLDFGSGFEVEAEMRLSGIAASLIQTCTFLVPKGASYKLVSVSGSNSISYLKEISL